MRTYHDDAARARSRGLRLGGVLGGVPPPDVPRRPDGGRRRRCSCERTERGDDMFMTSLARHAQQVLDLDADELLRPASEPPPPLRPSRRRGPPRARRASSCGTRAGTSTRSPRTAASAPTYGSACTRTSAIAWYTAYVCGPGPAGRGAWSISRRRSRRASICAAVGPTGSWQSTSASEPLERFRVHARRDRRVARRPVRVRCAASAGEPVPRCARPHLGDRRRALRLYGRDALRDPVPGRGHGADRRRGARPARARPARPLVGRARLVVDGLDVERDASRRRRRTCTRWQSGCPTARASASATCSPRAARP